VKDSPPTLGQDLRLLILEDFSFTANGGIETVRLSLVPEFARLCPVVWTLPQSRISNTIKKLSSLNGIIFEALNPSRFTKSWYIARLSKIISKFENLFPYGSFSVQISAWSKRVHLESIIKKHRITHLLNLGVFDQPILTLSVPVFGIVYDINYQPSIRTNCMNNLFFWLQKAAGIIAVSNFSRDQIVTSFPSRNCLVHSVPIAVTPPPHLSPVEGRLDELNQPTFFYPASLNIHKNHGLLLRALALVYEQGYSFKMVFCGAYTQLLTGSQILQDYQLEDARLFLANSSSEFRSCIQAYGAVEQSYVEHLFQQATCILLPTSYEGFGLPLTEAALRGIPVICSDIPPFQEQVSLYNLKNGVTFVNDSTPHAWSISIIKTLNDLEQLSNPDEENKHVWKRWTWQDVANSYISILQPGLPRSSATNL